MNAVSWDGARVASAESVRRQHNSFARPTFVSAISCLPADVALDFIAASLHAHDLVWELPLLAPCRLACRTIWSTDSTGKTGIQRNLHRRITRAYGAQPVAIDTRARLAVIRELMTWVSVSGCLGGSRAVSPSRNLRLRGF
jgi:hypothetical protein